MLGLSKDNFKVLLCKVKKLASKTEVSSFFQEFFYKKDVNGGFSLFLSVCLSILTRSVRKDVVKELKIFLKLKQLHKQKICKTSFKCLILIT